MLARQIQGMPRFQSNEAKNLISFRLLSTSLYDEQQQRPSWPFKTGGSAAFPHFTYRTFPVLRNLCARQSRVDLT